MQNIFKKNINLIYINNYYIPDLFFSSHFQQLEDFDFIMAHYNCNTKFIVNL